MFGPRYAEPVILPECTSSNSRQKKLTDELLNAADRGVHFSVDGGNIVAVRKCRYILFRCRDNVNAGELKKASQPENIGLFIFNAGVYTSV